MSYSSNQFDKTYITTFNEFIQLADYSLIKVLKSDPDSTIDGNDFLSREVFSGHYVPVQPTPINEPQYVLHSRTFFKELGLSDNLIFDQNFCKFFSGDISSRNAPMKVFGWATGYALSIYGTEYNQQCPFGTGNGYGDGRAISIFEGIFNGKRWEMQLKGSGPTPYCRGADGRAVLRSSIREFLAQEYMHALGVPTSRSLTLYVSKSEIVSRPWYSKKSKSAEPDIWLKNPVAISTRVASSFLRVGQLELFARRVRNKAHPKAFEELNMIADYLIKREYKNDISQSLPFKDQIVELAQLFRHRLILLIVNWLRIGYCQGNFNSDNCAAGGFTLDYGPFGFCENFDPKFQPWIGGGDHFSFFNQPAAAEANFHMFWKSIRPLISHESESLTRIDQVRMDFTKVMNKEIEKMWAGKLGLNEFNYPLVQELWELMMNSEVDYTIFFRELSHIPEAYPLLKKSFYSENAPQIEKRWELWFANWRKLIINKGNTSETSKIMKLTNPKYTWREWLVLPAYEQAETGDYSLIKELQSVFSNPYAEQSSEIEDKYYRLKPKDLFDVGGISHYSCSS